MLKQKEGLNKLGFVKNVYNNGSEIIQDTKDFKKETIVCNVFFNSEKSFRSTRCENHFGKFDWKQIPALKLSS